MRNPEKYWDRLAKDVDPQSDQLDEDQNRMVQKISKYLTKDDVVLDYGCARGGISLALADNVKMIHGIDLSFEVIFALNVLHLVENPNQTIARINELLKPSGRFIFETSCLKGQGKILGPM